MWLNDISLNIDGIALCNVLVLNQIEQGLRHLLGCTILLSLCRKAFLRLGRPATFDLHPKEPEASPCLLFLLFPSPTSKKFHYKGLLSATYSSRFAPSFSFQHTCTCTHTCTHTHTQTRVYNLLEYYSRSKDISKYKNHRISIPEGSTLGTPTLCRIPPTHLIAVSWSHKPNLTVFRDH